MGEYYSVVRSNNELMHYGVKGQKWGVRRYQNADGSLNAKGKAKLNEWKAKQYRNTDKRYKVDKKADKAGRSLTELNEKAKTGPVTKRDVMSTRRKLTKYYMAEGMSRVEKSTIANKRLSDIKKENIQKGAIVASSIAAGAFVINPVIAGGVGGAVSTINRNANRGLDNKTIKRIETESKERAKRDAYYDYD